MKKRSPDKKGQGTRVIQALDRGLVLLEALSAEEGEVSLSKLAARFPWDKSTTHRLLATLLCRGYVDQDPETSKYRLGLQLLSLSSALNQRLDIKRSAGRFVEALAQASRETAHLAVFDRGEAVILNQTDSPERIRIHTYVGMRLPVHCSSLGKVLLAAMSGEQQDRWIEEIGLESYTEKTITDPKRLKTHLAQVCQQGYALDDEEYAEEIRCIASPVKNSEGQIVAAVGISGPSHRFSAAKRERYIQLVKAAAENSSKSIGFVPGDPHRPSAPRKAP